MGGIGIVVNPRSRQNQRDPRAALRLARTLGDHGVVRTARSRDDLAHIAEDFRKLEIDVLGISGGDGTNHVTITGFLEVYADEPLPPLAFLRGGTFNTVANAVGVPRGRPDGVLARLIRSHAAREPLQHVERHVMRMGSPDDVGARPGTGGGGHYGFIFGTGAIYGFISDYNQAEVRDAAWAAKVLARASANVIAGRPTPVAQRWEGKVTVDGGEVFPDRDYLAIGAGTVDQIGLGFRPFYRSDHAPGTFHILGIHTSAMGFVRKLPDVWKARPMGPDHTYDQIAQRAVIEAREGVVRYVCDGDVHDHEGPLAIEAGPRVRILVENKPGIRPLEAVQRLTPSIFSKLS